MKIFVEAHSNMKQSKVLKLLMLKTKLFTFTYMYIHCITFLGIRFYCIIYIPYTMIIWIGSLTSGNRVNFVRFRLTSHVKVTYWCQMSKKKCWYVNVCYKSLYFLCIICFQSLKWFQICSVNIVNIYLTVQLIYSFGEKFRFLVTVGRFNSTSFQKKSLTKLIITTSLPDA